MRLLKRVGKPAEEIVRMALGCPLDVYQKGYCLTAAGCAAAAMSLLAAAAGLAALAAHHGLSILIFIGLVLVGLVLVVHLYILLTFFST